jgi:hypothetical protein
VSGGKGGIKHKVRAGTNLAPSLPRGYHDDCVMALALANHRRWELESCERVLMG